MGGGLNKRYAVLLYLAAVKFENLLLFRRFIKSSWLPPQMLV